MRALRRSVVFGAVLSASAATLCCGRGEAAPSVGKSDARPRAPSVAGSAAWSRVPGEGAGHGGAGAPPEDLPGDIPSYPGARIVRSSGVSGEEFLIAFQSADAPEKIFEFYREKLAQQGWSVEGEMSSADQAMLIAGKGDRKASVLVSSGDSGETQITLTLTREEG
jgi:hypothetical protein